MVAAGSRLGRCTVGHHQGQVTTVYPSARAPVSQPPAPPWVSSPRPPATCPAAGSGRFPCGAACPGQPTARIEASGRPEGARSHHVDHIERSRRPHCARASSASIRARFRVISALIASRRSFSAAHRSSRIRRRSATPSGSRLCARRHGGRTAGTAPVKGRISARGCGMMHGAWVMTHPHGSGQAGKEG